jgi:predicted ATPase
MTLEAVTAQLEALSRSNPILMIFEDVHWVDPTSLEALGRAVDRIRALRVLLIVTYRPEFEPPWIGRPHVAALSVNRLGEREIAVMIDRIIGNKSLPASIRHDIIERTDGIPLFVEEITKSVVEAVGEGGAERAIAAIPSSSVAVPASLHASLMARLDRLGSAKDVTQIGAVIGREFSHALVAAVARKSEAELQSALERLIAAGLLFRQGVPPHATYLFKHALVQDAAYGTLLRSRRQELHRQIVSALQQDFPELVLSQPETLAHHSAESGMLVEAIEYYVLAAKRATAGMNNKEAKADLKRGMTLVEQLPASEPRRTTLLSRVGGAGWWWSS